MQAGRKNILEIGCEVWRYSFDVDDVVVCIFVQHD